MFDLKLDLDLDLDLDFMQVNWFSDLESCTIIEHHQYVLRMCVFFPLLYTKYTYKPANCSEMFVFNYKKKRRQIEIVFAFNMLCK